MKLEKLLKEKSDEILREAGKVLEKSHLSHYETVGKISTQIYLKNLFTLTIKCIKSKSILAINEYAEKLAEDRFEAGFDLYEVQHAFNVLEEAIWMTIIHDLPPDEYAEALRLTSTILGAGKEALACKYVKLASKHKIPCRDISALFKGTDGFYN